MYWIEIAFICPHFLSLDSTGDRSGNLSRPLGLCAPSFFSFLVAFRLYKKFFNFHIFTLKSIIFYVPFWWAWPFIPKATEILPIWTLVVVDLHRFFFWGDGGKFKQRRCITQILAGCGKDQFLSCLVLITADHFSSFDVNVVSHRFWILNFGLMTAAAWLLTAKKWWACSELEVF